MGRLLILALAGRRLAEIVVKDRVSLPWRNWLARTLFPDLFDADAADDDQLGQAADMGGRGWRIQVASGLSCVSCAMVWATLLLALTPARRLQLPLAAARLGSKV